VLPVVPATTSGDGGSAEYTSDDDRIAELVGDAVPFPLSPGPDRRVRVRLLNGTTDRDLTPAVARQLVVAGAEITIAGNASSFDVEETTFAYRSSDERAGAERLAEAVGFGTVEPASPSATAGTVADTGGDGEGNEIDVTIVLGADARDLIRRLESTG